MDSLPQEVLDSFTNLDYALSDIGVDTLGEALEQCCSSEIPFSVELIEDNPLRPNIFYDLGVVEDDFTLYLNTEIELGITKEYMFQFDTGDTVPTITWPDDVMWVEEPDIEANHRYQVSILNNVGLIVGVELQ